MPSALVRFQTIEVFVDDGGSFSLAPMIDDDPATIGYIESSAYGQANSVIMSNPAIPDDFGDLDGDVSIAFQWYMVPSTQAIERAGVFTREDSDAAWIERFNAEIPSTETTQVITFPVTSLPDLQVLVQNYYEAAGGGDAPPPPWSA